MGLIENDDWNSPSLELLTDTVTLQEAMSSSGRQGVIGVVRGPFFFPDGISENKRFYPRNLWENILSSDRVSEKLANNVMFGKIGHADRPVIDEDLEKGIISHVISKLYIQGEQGLGEALILDTPAGRNLKAYLAAGCKLKISSRATGGFLEGRTHQGMPIVDGGKYLLETFDFVLNAGFKNTNPVLAEGKTNEKITMETDKIVKQLLEDRSLVQTQLTESAGKVESLSEENRSLREELEYLREGEATVQKGMQLAESLGYDSFENLLEALEGADMGAIQTVISTNLSEAELQEYIDLGSASEISEALEQSIAVLESYKVIGSAEQIQTTLEIVDEALEGYLEFGTVAEVSEKLADYDSMCEEMEEARIAELAIDKAAQYGLDPAVVESLASRYDDEAELEAMLESLSKQASSGKRRSVTAAALNEDHDQLQFEKTSGNAASRLFNRLNKAPAA